MGISRDTRHKRRATGGKRAAYRKKRKYELGRPGAYTKIGEKRIHLVRTRGGNKKYRALRLETGNVSWGSESVTRKSRILVVVYNASNNELVRTNTLVKNCIIQVDSAPFRIWYEQHYGVTLGKKKATSVASSKGSKAAAKVTAPAPAKAAAKGAKSAAPAKGAAKASAKSPAKGAAAPAKGASKVAAAPVPVPASKKENAPPVLTEKQKTRQLTRTLDPHLEEQFNTGRLYVCVSSRPGQSGRCDGYVLEGKELEFYLKKIQKKKK